MKWKNFIGVIMILLLSFTAGCTLFNSSTDLKPEKSDTNVTEKNETTPPVNPKPSLEEETVFLYFSDDQALYLKPEERIVTRGGRPLAQILIEEIIKGPQKEGLHKTIPSEAKLISMEVVNGVAFVNFSEEMKTKHWGGSVGERMTIQSVAHTLTQLPDIEKVQFLIEGKTEEAIWGHGYTGEPIAPAKDILEK